MQSNLRATKDQSLKSVSAPDRVFFQMSRRTLYFFFAAIWLLIETLLFAGAARYIYHEVTSRSAFRFPYCVFFFGLVRGYWWIALVSVPLLSWASVKVYWARRSKGKHSFT
jgi:hypothetical protein